MINAVVLSITFGFGFLTGAVLGVVVMLKALRKTQKELEVYTKLHKNKYDEDKDYNAY